MPIGLEYKMTCRFKVTGPLAATEGSPTGAKMYREMTSGTFEGDAINARIVMPGGDWHVVSADQFGRTDVRVQFELIDYVFGLIV